MAAKKINHVIIHKTKQTDFRKVAENFLNGAETASIFEYWNAAGVLIVHSAIAFTDAITIKLSGIKCKSQDHGDMIELLQHTLKDRQFKTRSMTHLKRIIDQKNLVSYSGEIYQESDIDSMWKHLNRYKEWAIGVLDK